MQKPVITHIIGFGLSGFVLLAALLMLVVGWGFDVPRLVRPGPGENAAVPCTALLLSLLALASLPLSSVRVAAIQIAAVLLALALLVLLWLPGLTGAAGPNWAKGWLMFVPRYGDGFSVAAQVGVLMACVAPLSRLQVFRGLSGVGVFVAFLGLVYFLSATLLIALMPWSIRTVPTLQFLSLHSAGLFTALFAAQLMVQMRQDPLRIEEDDVLSV